MNRGPLGTEVERRRKGSVCPAQPQGLDVTFKDKGTAVRTGRECTMRADAICFGTQVTKCDRAG